MSIRVTISNWLDGPWDQVREYLKNDLEHMAFAINRISIALRDAGIDTSSRVTGATTSTTTVTGSGTTHAQVMARTRLHL